MNWKPTQVRAKNMIDKTTHLFEGNNRWSTRVLVVVFLKNVARKMWKFAQAKA